MRWIVLFLFLANLGLAAWFLTAGGEPEMPRKPVAERGDEDTLVLVSEAPASQLSEASPPEQQKVQPARRSAGAAAPEAVGADGLCTLVGPFTEAYQGEDVARRLQALEVQAALREIEMQGQMRYWVYLAPLGSRREAFRKLRELQAAGIDSYVIPKGSLENGISFGIFSELERARSLTGDLQAQGFAAEYREEPQTYLELWVVLEGEERLADAFWQQIQLDYPDLDRRQNLCSEIRSPEAGAD
ncbi:SPOR domain-containing protein [Microbulbifer sp. SA54]|uniref:SPOR domain-containing protein n=1 Tax=Microbulbifer sp. SA54 TaxID=3401577 RepID=UPI003AAC829B